jgi:DNA-directed RNA polymerases I, II, and III subunit RPABC2
LNQDEEGDNIEIITPGGAGGGVPKNKRITTKYMTKYERARVSRNLLYPHKEYY